MQRITALVLVAVWMADAVLNAQTPAFSVAAILDHEQALAGAHDVELAGPLAVVAGKGGAVAIVDVAEPTRPKLLWHKQDEKALFDAETVLIDGPRLYLGTVDFFSIDITNPSQPKFDAKLADRPRIDRINGFARRGNYVLAANKEGFINAFDVSQPDRPKLFGAAKVDASGIGSPHDLDVMGDFAVVADPQGFGRRGRDGKLGVVRIADEKTHDLLATDQWTIAGVLESPQLRGANRVRVLGNYALVAASSKLVQPHFVSVDLSNPARPREAAAIPFTDRYGPNGMGVSGKVVFLGGGRTVEAIDVSDLASPRRLAAQVFADALPTNDANAHDLVYRDGHVFVTGQNDHRLVILRVDDAEIRRLADGK